LQEIDTVGTSAVVPFPYVPGLLSFRECPAVLRAWEKLRVIPDCIMCDGQGIAHPRRFGIASHLGVWLDIPAIGCAKSLLVGTYEEPGVKRGSFLPLVHRKEQVGVILRTKDNTGPVFVSQGHKISLRQAIEIVLACGTKYRIPEPTRRAHLVVNAMRRQANTPDA
jgi:deoxyribonuclease V